MDTPRSCVATQVIHDKFSVAYHPGHVQKILDLLGLSVQRPKKVLARADPIQQDKWRRYTTKDELGSSLFSVFKSMQKKPDQIRGYLNPLYRLICPFIYAQLYKAATVVASCKLQKQNPCQFIKAAVLEHFFHFPAPSLVIKT